MRSQVADGSAGSKACCRETLQDAEKLRMPNQFRNTFIKKHLGV